MKELLGFLKDKNGNLSSVRLYSFFIIIAFIIDWMHAVFTKGNYNPAWSLISLVGAIIGVKVLQTKFE